MSEQQQAGNLSSGEITVNFYRQILLWPLEVKRGEANTNKSNKSSHNYHIAPFLEKKSGFKKHWKKRENGFLSGDTPRFQLSSEQIFSGMVYFHPFVRRYLTSTDNVVVFQREDINRVLVEWSNSSLSLTVERVWLVTFDIDIVILLTEVSAENLALKQVLDLQDKLRRAFAPYWGGKDSNKIPLYAGHCADSVTWFCDNDEVKHPAQQSFELKNSAYFCNKLLTEDRTKSYLPVFHHWSTLLHPLDFVPQQGGLYLQHLLDERMPVMGFVAFNDPCEVSDPDWVRLSFSDESGNSSSFPYSRYFLRNWREQHCYDRYWDEQQQPDEQGYENAEWHTTRFLSCDHTFVMAGNDDTHKQYPFFCDATGGAEFHFRFHYLILNLIVQLQYATLLKLYNDMTVCIDKLHKAKTHSEIEKMKDHITDLTDRHRTFTHEYWFLEVSNQDQGKDLFRWLVNHLRIDQLYERVNREQADLENWLKQYEADRVSRATERLTHVATVVGFVGLVIALWSSQFRDIVDKGKESEKVISSLPMWEILLSLIPLFLAMGVSWVLYDELFLKKFSRIRNFSNWLKRKFC